MSYVNRLTELNVDSDIYDARIPVLDSTHETKFLKVKSDGTFETGVPVVANPTLAGSEAALAGLQIGDTKYKVEASGGTDEALESAKENGGIGWKKSGATVTWDGDTTGKTKIERLFYGADGYLISTDIPSSSSAFIGQTIKFNINGTVTSHTIQANEIQDYGTQILIRISIDSQYYYAACFLSVSYGYPAGIWFSKSSDASHYTSEISYGDSVHQIEPEFINAEGGIGWKEYTATTWDGNTEGKTVISYNEVPLYLISSATPPAINNFIGGIINAVDGTETASVPITSNIIDELETNAYAIFCGEVAMVLISYGSTTYPTPGLWFSKITESELDVYASGISYLTTVHKVTPTFIQGSSTANQVLTSDASGNVSWQNPSGSSGVTDVKFDGTSVVTNNVANLYTDEALDSAKENNGIGYFGAIATPMWDGDITGKTPISVGSYEQYYLGSTEIVELPSSIEGRQYSSMYLTEGFGEAVIVQLEELSNAYGVRTAEDSGNSAIIITSSVEPFTTPGVYAIYQGDGSEFFIYAGKVVVGETTYTWDGDTTGKTKVEYDDEEYYLISETLPSTYTTASLDLKGFESANAEITKGDGATRLFMEIAGIIITTKANATITINEQSYTFPTAGVYYDRFSMVNASFIVHGIKVWNVPSLINSSFISSGSATSGKVLTADGSGGISWQTPSGGVTDVTMDGTSVLDGTVAKLTTDEALASAKTTGGIGWQTTYQSPEWDGDITGKTPVVVRGGTKYYLGSTSIVNLPSEVTSSDTWNCTLTMHDVVSGLAISPLEDHPTSYGPDGDSSFVMVIMPDELFTEVGTYLMKFSIEGTTVYVSEVKVGTLTVTWDGDTTGKTSVECGDYTYYKITNEAVSSPTQYTADIKTAATTYDELYVTPGDGACAFVCDTGGFLFTNKDNATITSQSVTYTFPTAGVYYTAQYSSGEGMYFSKVILDPISNKINSSYISSGSATSGYVLTADGSGSTSWAAAPGASGTIFNIAAVCDGDNLTLTSVDKTYAQLLAAYDAGNLIATTLHETYEPEQGGDMWYRDTDCVKSEVREQESPYTLLGYEFTIGLRGTRGLPNRGYYLVCNYQDGWSFHTYE